MGKNGRRGEVHSMLLPTFHWTTFDVGEILPRGWQSEVLSAAGAADFRSFPRTPVVSREGEDIARISRGRVHADQVREALPWLRQLYTSAFAELAQRATGLQIAAAHDERYGVVLNVQRGPSMHFECHVDSNPISGLLFCTDHAPGAGGELVVAHNCDAISRDEVDRSYSALWPHAGHLVFFDGRRHPHYARPLAAASDIRVVAVMNYYTSASPESERPPELNRHLYGDR